MNNAGTLLLIMLGIVGIIILCVIVPPLQTIIGIGSGIGALVLLIITLKKIHRSMQTNDFQFHSTRTKEISEKEIYVLAIGESVRYDNCSLNGIYTRQTMPLIAQQDNLVFFHNYYSSGTTTSVSVPMIVTRATAEENALNYQERGIVQVFNENGFTTVVIKRGILSQISSAYLYQGVDYTVDVESDAEVIEKVDS